MKAAEVLRRYAAGDRNFQRVDLRGQSFKGADLSGADFSETDIRSTNFKNANLQGVNFTGAKAGLQEQWVAFLLGISILTSTFSGFFSVFIASLVSRLFNDIYPTNYYIVILALIILVIFLIITIRRGIIYITFTVAAAYAVAVAIIVTVASNSSITFAIAVARALAVAVAIIVVGAIVGAATYAMSVAIVITVAFVFAVIVAFAVAAAVTVGYNIVPNYATIAVFAYIITIVVALCGFYIGWRALKGDERDAWIRSFAIASVAIGGTSFQCANLTNAIFNGATLKNTDFRKSILTGTYFREAKKLDLVRPGNTYLNNLKLQRWLTGIGKNNNFDRQILRGVNFQGKILTDASFIGADLSEANLQDVDLSRAKLVQTQLDGTDFTGATLTGAIIEDWNITVNTNLRGVKCDYIYMRLPTQKNINPLRKPDNENENFADGDFEDFIKPIFDTLDLYHNQNVDPRAVALSWKKLAENNPNADIRFAAMEVKGENSLLLRFKTALGADKSKLNAEYFETYIELQALNAANKKLLVEKDDRIKELEKMVHSAINAPKYYTDQSRKIEVSDSTLNSSGAAGFGLGDISGTAANEINQPLSSNDKNTP